MSIAIRVIAVLALIVALGPNPYSYYMLLRDFVCIVTVYLALTANKARQTGWLWSFIGIAVLFNPFLPVYLERSTWTAIDLITACIFLVSLFSVPQRQA